MTSMPTTASVRIRVPKGSPSLIARQSACRTTPKAEIRIAPKSQRKRNHIHAALDKSDSHAFPNMRKSAVLARPLDSSHSVRRTLEGGGAVRVVMPFD
jgi:hypothetical protein